MTVPPHDEEQEKPLYPAVENVRRKLVRFIIINLGILFLALMAVVVALVYRATRVTAPPQPAVISDLPLPAGDALLEGEIALPNDARVVSHALSGNVLSLQVEFGGGERAIFLYDVSAGRMIGRFSIR